MRRFLPLVLVILWGGALDARAEIDDALEDLLTIDTPAGLCPFDGEMDGPEVNPALKNFIFGHQVILAAFEPCGDSAWPEGSAIGIGLLSEDGKPRQLGIARAQYLARLARREGPADWETLRNVLDNPESEIVDGMVPAGLVHQDALGVHFGFILTGGSRSEADWRLLILGSSLSDGYPILISSVAPYGDAENSKKAVQRHVAVANAVIAANTSSRDRDAFDYMPWVKYGAGVLIVLFGAAVTWDWCRRRRRMREAEPENDPGIELDP